MSAASTLSTTEIIIIIEDEIAIAERACGTYSDDPANWHRLFNHEMALAGARLASSIGARTSVAWDGARVRIVGRSATSTGGLRQALQNWITAARKREEARP